MIKFINLNKEKYDESDYYIKTIFNIKGYAVQIIVKKK